MFELKAVQIRNGASVTVRASSVTVLMDHLKASGDRWGIEISTYPNEVGHGSGDLIRAGSIVGHWQITAEV